MACGRPHKVPLVEQVEPAHHEGGNAPRNEAPEVPPTRAQEDEIVGLQEAMRLQPKKIRQQNK